MSPVEEQLAPYEAQLAAVYLGLFLAGCVLIHRHGRRLWRNLRAAWPGQRLHLAGRPWQWLDVGAVIAPVLALGAAFHVLTRDRYAAGDFLPMAVSMILTHGTLLLVAILLTRLKRVSLTEAFGSGRDRFRGDVRAGLGGYVAMIVAVLPAMLLSAGLMRLLGREPAHQDIVSLFAEQNGMAARVFICVWTVLIAPAGEEVLFRGLLLPLLLRRLSPVLAVALASCGFAAMHLDATAFLPLFAVSACLSLAFLATGSLVVSITMHALFNSVTVAVLMLTG